MTQTSAPSDPTPSIPTYTSRQKRRFPSVLARNIANDVPVQRGWNVVFAPGEAAIERQTMSADQYFLLGDNRTNSADSRMYGPVARSNIKSRLSAVVWPVRHIRTLD